VSPQRPVPLRVEQHDIGVGTDRQRPLPRVEPHDLRGVRRHHADEVVETVAATLHHVRVHQRNARLDPRLWDDCTQEVCCRLLTKAQVGELDMTQVLAEDTPERRELVRAIDMVRKRVQRTKRYQPLDAFTTPALDLDQRHRDRLELGEILEAARRAVLTARQDRIIELWMRGWSVPEIGAELKLPVTRVSDEKYKALRKLERQLGNRRDELEFGLPSTAAAQLG